MNKRNIVIAVVSLAIGVGIGIEGSWLMLPNKSKQQVQVTKEPAKVEEKSEGSKTQLDDVVIPETYAETAIRYIKTIKTGKSTDLYSDRLNKVKNLLNDKMLDKLSPDMTEQEIESEKEYAKSIDKDQITTTKITDINYSYFAKSDNKFEISVIYTLRTQQKDRNDLQRYLCRMNVEKNSDEYKITNIYEDSALFDGIY